MARTKRPTRSETKKTTASTPARPADDIAVALLGLKNSATKKVKKKTSNTSTRRKLVKTPSKRRKKTPTKLNRGSARKTKKTPRSTSAKKNPFKTPKTTKSKKGKTARNGSSSSSAKRRKVKVTKKETTIQYYVNPNRIDSEIVKKIVDLTKDGSVISRSASRTRRSTVTTTTTTTTTTNANLSKLLETARKTNEAVQEEYIKDLNDGSPRKRRDINDPIIHYHRNHHHSVKKEMKKNDMDGNSNNTNRPTAKRKIVDISSPSSSKLANTKTRPIKKKRVQPNRVYVKRSPGSNGMKGFCNKAKNKSFLPFEDARAIIHQLKLNGSRAWWHWSKHYRPENIPSTPDITYRKQGWKGMKDWLGNSVVRRRSGVSSFLPFHEARAIVRKLGLKSKEEWRQYSRTKRPATIPSTPQRTYKDNGYNGLADWLGKDTTNSSSLSKKSSSSSSTTGNKRAEL